MTDSRAILRQWSGGACPELAEGLTTSGRNRSPCLSSAFRGACRRAQEDAYAGDLAKELGLVGLGRMGGNMVQRLLAGVHSIVGYDPNQEAVESVVQ